MMLNWKTWNCLFDFFRSHVARSSCKQFFSGSMSRRKNLSWPEAHDFLVPKFTIATKKSFFILAEIANLLLATVCRRQLIFLRGQLPIYSVTSNEAATASGARQSSDSCVMEYSLHIIFCSCYRCCCCRWCHPKLFRKLIAENRDFVPGRPVPTKPASFSY